MRRREFITFLGGTAAWPLVADAQQSALPVVGFLRPNRAEEFGHLVAAVRQGLRESGYTNDKADQASRNVRKPPFKLLPGGLQLQNDVSALIETN
jgi:hypothetical protein